MTISYTEEGYQIDTEVLNKCSIIKWIRKNTSLFGAYCNDSSATRSLL